jgi:hypothetical protein
MKIKGDLIIEKGNQEDFSELTEVSGYVYVRQGATFTAPALAEYFFKLDYKNLFEYHHIGKFQPGVYVTVNEKEISLLAQLKPLINRKRLAMSHWHQNENWKNKTAEKVINECNTTHCMYGWFQIFAKDEFNHLTTEEAGKIMAPNLHQFVNSSEEFIERMVNTLIPN